MRLIHGAAALVLAAACGGSDAGHRDGGSGLGDGRESESSDSGAADDGGDRPDVGAEARELPCDVQTALASHCWMCHGAVPAFGAPMALTSYDDTQVPARSDPARPVFDLMAQRLVDPGRPMPPNGEMPDADLELLLDWIRGGAGTGPGCEPGPDAPSDPVGPEFLPCDPELFMTAPQFAVPAQGADDLYMCFAFRPELAQQAQATAFAPIIDDTRVLHHWILYSSALPREDGAVFPCGVALQASAQYVAGWAPGGGNIVLPDDVGMDLGGPETTFILQIHYNNTARYDDVVDSSGVAVCTTSQPRAQTAGVLTVGTLAIDIPPRVEGFGVTGTCGPLSTLLWPRLRVVSTAPHMHELGRAIRTEIERTDGTLRLLTDVPQFTFDNQRVYPLDPAVVVEPGSSLRTTCVYDNPGDARVRFGEGTGDEMCFNFLTAYPVDTILERNCGIVF